MNFVNRRTLQDFFSTADRKLLATVLGVALTLIAVVVGGMLALIGPLYTLALLAALAGGVWVILDLDHALYSIIAVITLLPFATLPVDIGLTPTFLDMAMGAAVALYMFQWMTGERRTLKATPVHAFLILFILLSIFSFVAGLRYAWLTPTVVRRFAELLLSMGFALILVDILRDYEKIRRMVLVLVLSGGLAAFIGVGLWLAPDLIAERILVRLAVVGYPNVDVIRYIEQNPELAERAISTSVNPNALGGLLVMITALAVPQLAADKPVLPKRWMAYPAVGFLLLCLILTFSRGSMLAFGVAVVFIALVRYPKLLLVPIVLGAFLAVLPISQEYIQRFVEGFQGADLATQMRFGEYKDAFILIRRYPLLGVGFTGAPDIDIYLGVASVYLTIAGNMGLLGVAAFLVLMTTLFLYAWSARQNVKGLLGHEAIWLGLIAGIIGALFNGIFDHYFFNLDFHPAVAIFWIFVGLLLAITRVTKESAEEAQTDHVVNKVDDKHSEGVHQQIKPMERGTES